MAIETYIPSQVTFAGSRVDQAFALTLYNPDAADAAGALTTHAPPAEGTRGALEVVGARDGRTWRVTIDEIEISRATAVGCEFTIFGALRRTPQ